MIFWLVLKLEISYNRSYNNILKDFGFLLGRGFWKDYTFCMMKYLSSHNSSFALDTFSYKWQGHTVTHPLLY
jgi:hypothetical protein